MLDNVTNKPLNVEENNELVTEIRDGNYNAYQQFIAGNTPLVKYKVGSWLAEYPHLKYLEDDMMSEGLLALTIATDKMRTRAQFMEANVTGYISVSIHRAIGRFLTREKRNTSGIYHAALASKNVVEEDPTTFIDFLDSLFGACDTEEHRIIIKMRAEGFDDNEIASVLDCSRQTVQVMKSEVFESLCRDS